MVQNSRREEYRAHGGDRLGHDERARLNWVEAEADLLEERQDERHATDAEPGEEAAAHGRAEGADAKQTQPQQRERRSHRVQPVTHDQRDRQRQQP